MEGKKSWTVERRFEEFESFHTALVKMTVRVPDLP